MLALVVASLSTGHKIGLATVGAAFIVFALVSSFVLPRRIPNFPGRFMGLYLTICGAVLRRDALGGADLRQGEGGGAPGKGHDHDDRGADDAPRGTLGEGRRDRRQGGLRERRCATCHTLKDAGSHGTIGPNLDQLKPAEDVVQHQVENGGGPMPAFKGQLTAKQIQDVAAYVFTATHSS